MGGGSVTLTVVQVTDQIGYDFFGHDIALVVVTLVPFVDELISSIHLCLRR